jgi:uncharacterized membrane protein (DUF373 family)
MIKPANWDRLQTQWAALSYYQRFEGFVALVLTLVIALIIMVVSRKFIILDLNTTSADQLLGLAAVTLVLGLSYWLMRERDDRLTDTSKGLTR